MPTVNWTTATNPAHAIHASLEGSDKRFASLGRTAMGIQLCLYPSGATGEGRNHRVASIAQGKRFLERWVAHHEGKVRRIYGVSRQPGWPDERLTGPA
jgi:hypothetical protein